MKANPSNFNPSPQNPATMTNKSLALRQTKSIALCLGLLVAFSSPKAFAASRYWDTSAAAGLQPGDGTWDTGTTAQWKDAPAGVTFLTWADNDDAVFQTTAGTSIVTLSGTIVANTVTQIGSSNPTILNGGTLQLNSAATALSGASGNLTINSNVVLGASQTWGGTVRVNGSVSGAFTITTGNTSRLILNGTNSFAGISSSNSGGSSVLITLGGGGTTLSGALTLSGAGSKLTSGANNAFGSISVSSNGGYAQLGGTNTITGGVTAQLGGMVAVDSDASLGGVGTAFTSGNNGGILRILGTNFTTFGAKSVTFTGEGATMDIADPANTFTFNKGISTAFMNSTSSFVKSGRGTLILNQVNTSTGTYNARGGTLIVDSEASGSASASVAATSKLALSGGTFQLTGKNDGTTNQTMGAVTVNTYGGTVKVNGGPVGATLALGTITATEAGSALNFETTGTAPVITTTTTVDGSGIYSGRITFNGADWATTTSGAVAAYGGYSALNTAAGTDGLNSRITAGGTTALAAGAHTTNTLKIDNASSGALDIGGTSLTLAGGGLLLTGGTDYAINNGNLNSSLGANSDLIIHQNGAGTLTINGVITDGAGAQTLTKTGNGRLVLGTNNTYTGQTYINGGTLSGSDFNFTGGSNLGGAAATTGVNINGGTLQYTGVTDSTSRTLALGNNGGTIQVDGGSGVVLTWSGVISNTAGAASLTKTGTGTLLLNPGSNANSFSGGVFINDGVLQLGATQSLGSSSVPNIITFGAASTGTLRLNGQSTLIAGLKTNATVGTPIVENANATAATLTVNSAFADTYAGVIQNGTGAGALSIVKENANTLTLSGANTYTGTTTINSGTLLINGTHTGAGAYSVSSSGTLGGTGSLSGAVTVSAGGTISPGSSIESLATGSNTWNGGGALTFEFSTDGSTGAAGSQWDLLAITGNLDLSGASVGNKFILNLVTMANATNPGILGTWDADANHTWAGFVTTTTAFVGFDAGSFSFNTAGFQNTLNGSFSVAINGSNLDLNYTAVPEPSTWALLAFSLTTVMVLRRRRIS